ncbi:MAG: tripartite tricarboxylate transporter TctB family protein [Xanthobacteraceae bacterium]
MATAVNKRDLGAGLVVLAIGLVFLLWSQIYPPRMSVMPKLVGWITIVLALIDIIAQFDTAPGRALRRAAGLQIDDLGGGRKERAKPSWRRIVMAMLWVVGYVAAIYVIGLLTTTPIYIFFYMLLNGGKPVRASALTAVTLTAAIWFVFEYLFHYPLYPGLLFGGS